MSAEPKRVLAVCYTQTGQLRRILDSVLAPLRQAPGVEVTLAEIRPVEPFPFPWPVLRFFDTFPETVYEDVPPVTLEGADPDKSYDLVILAYQVWFLSPSMPMTAFLKSPEAERLLKGKRVVTLIGCRNMWLMAQERMKEHIARLGGVLVDNAVLTDDAHAAFTFISTPLWMLTGDRGPFFGGRVPRAGVPDHEIVQADRFGAAIARALAERSSDDARPMLAGLGAVRVNERLIGSEKVAKRSFMLWGGLLRALGRPGALLRRAVLLLYITFLVTLILTVVPLLAIVKKLLTPLTRERIAKEKAYFAHPSGEALEAAAEQAV